MAGMAWQHSRVEVCRGRQRKARVVGAWLGFARQAGLGIDRHHVVGHGRRGRFGAAGCGAVRCGMAGRSRSACQVRSRCSGPAGSAHLGQVRLDPGTARQVWPGNTRHPGLGGSGHGAAGMAPNGSAWHGQARQAGLGVTGQGSARHGRQGPEVWANQSRLGGAGLARRG
jgi:hypothetical protein